MIALVFRMTNGSVNEKAPEDFLPRLWMRDKPGRIRDQLVLPRLLLFLLPVLRRLLLPLRLRRR